MVDDPFRPITDEEADRLLAPLKGWPCVALAVSGGADSTALMWLAARWQRRRGGAPAVHVLTVDHGLRPEAAAECEKVADLAARLDLLCTILRWRPPADLSSGLQAAARAARYRLMGEWCMAHEAVLVTAHTLEDQAETFLMRLARGSGVDGLAGMAPIARVPFVEERLGRPPPPHLLRPLLEVPRARLRATLQAAGIAWIEDPSNRDDAFERVRVRRLLKILEEAGVSPAAMARSARRLQRAADALEAAAAEVLHAHLTPHRLLWGELPLEALCPQPEEVRLRVLRRLIAAFGASRPYPLPLEDLERLLAEWFDPACADPDRPPGGRTLGGAFLRIRRRQMVIGREPGRIRHALVLEPGEKVVTGLWDGRVHITLIKPSAPVRVTHLGALTKSSKDVPLPEDMPRRPRRTPAPAWAAQPVVVSMTGEVLALPLMGWQVPHAPFARLRARPARNLLAGPIDGED